MAHWESLLEELVATRRRALVGYAYVLTGDVAAAEDLVHESLLRTFNKPRGLKDIGHAEGYVRRTIATQFLNGRRKHSRFLAKVHLFGAVDVPRDPQEGAGVVDAVRAAMQRLTPRERACIALRHYEQLQVREIAHALGLAEGTVKRYLADASAKLQADLGPDFGPGERAPETVVVTSNPSRRTS